VGVGQIGIGGVLLGALASGPLTCLEAGEDEPTEVRTARQIWMSDCTHCHGPTGRGDGEQAPGLDPPVPDFGDPCKTRTNAQIEWAIMRGGESFAGNPAMRAHHELADAPEVLGTLVTYVQAMRVEGECKGSGGG
jgi:mono/diheme cytochrome c family protein